MAGVSLDCALLTLGVPRFPFDDMLLATRDVRMSTLAPGAMGLSQAPNPYRLPLTDRASVALIETRWYKWLRAHGADVLKRTFDRIELACDRIVGIEGYDTVRLGAPPEALDRYEMLLKSQGVYRDRDLYNYRVGPYFPGARWTEKSEPAMPRYSQAQLDKIRLSVPCFVGVDERIRRRVRRADGLPWSSQATRAFAGFLQTKLIQHGPHLRESAGLACFVGAMTHVQRRDLVLRLRAAGLSGVYGITSVPEYIFGRECPTERLTPIERHAIEHQLNCGQGLTARMSRFRVRRTMQNHLVALAPVGYGELTHRHAEGWEAGVAVLCQSLDHVDTMYPFHDEENVIYCRPDMEDVVERLLEVKDDPDRARRIGENGRRCWQEWIGPIDDVLRRGITAHLR